RGDRRPWLLGPAGRLWPHRPEPGQWLVGLDLDGGGGRLWLAPFGRPVASGWSVGGLERGTDRPADRLSRLRRSCAGKPDVAARGRVWRDRLSAGRRGRCWADMGGAVCRPLLWAGAQRRICGGGDVGGAEGRGDTVLARQRDGGRAALGAASARWGDGL